METWFLGNRRIYARNASNVEVAMYSKHYNISSDDPELMRVSDDFSGSIGDFHYQYLKTMLRQKNIRYSKSNPKEVIKSHYIGELQSRLDTDANSLHSMRVLFNFLEQISSRINA